MLGDAKQFEFQGLNKNPQLSAHRHLHHQDNKNVRPRKALLHCPAVRSCLLQTDKRLINSMAILSEDRFLLKSKVPRCSWLTRVVGWSAQPDATGFGGDSSQSVKTKMINLISAVRTLMRSMRFNNETDGSTADCGEYLGYCVWVIVGIMGIYATLDKIPRECKTQNGNRSVQWCTRPLHLLGHRGNGYRNSTKRGTHRLFVYRSCETSTLLRSDQVLPDAWQQDIKWKSRSRRRSINGSFDKTMDTTIRES